MYVYSWVPNPEFGGGGGRGGAEMGKEIGQCWWMLYHIEVFFNFSFVCTTDACFRPLTLLLLDSILT